ncbi:MAG: hypothetical protein NTY19_33505 [Planctomycetota bacterium]|nr:hypothetical protein [Planctomycetota bacterium]
MLLLVEMRDFKDVRPPRLVTVKITKSGKRIEVAAVAKSQLTSVTIGVTRVSRLGGEARRMATESGARSKGRLGRPVVGSTN